MIKKKIKNNKKYRIFLHLVSNLNQAGRNKGHVNKNHTAIEINVMSDGLPQG